MKPFKTSKTLLSAVALAVLAALPAAALAQSLEMGKGGLRLLDAQGGVTDEFSVRAKRWDQRRLPDGSMLALLHDADSNTLRLLEARGGSLRARASWAGPNLDLEALCLYLEPRQQLLQVFLLGSDGLAEQWLLTDKPAANGQSLRQFAAVPDAKACTVRDDEGQLYIAEDRVGLWAFLADPERAGRTLAAPGLAPQDMASWLEARAAVPAPVIPVVVPSAQTAPVRGVGDAADDPAIWVHPSRPAQSRIVGTDKKRGLAVYDLQGRETQFLPVGRVNNVDIRQGVRAGGRAWDLAVATQRDQRSVLLFRIDAAGRLEKLATLPTGLDEVYGICSARHPGGGLDIFVNDKDGRLLQMRLTRQGKTWRTETVATLRLDSQPEGCVADEAGHQLFVGEEKRGLWRVALDAEGRMGASQLILPIGEVLHADVEGMAVHRNARGASLVVSSQGNDSFVVLDAHAPFAVKGRFRVGLNTARGIDGVSETDGLDVTAASLGGAYGEGLLVVQDG
ncbi:MAG: phytase, partial [Burkholderiaceae bacterium]